MSGKNWMRFWLTALLLLFSGQILAQEEAEELPSQYTLSGFRYEAQMWNNCGPATITMALSYFGYADNQVRAANWLKPDTEDKNVSPWQLMDYVDGEVSELAIGALTRYGGTLDTLKGLLVAGYPVMIEAGYDPPRADQGWMGHYLLVVGYNDATEMITTYDSYDGQNMEYSYDHIEEFWQHFNYIYLVFYELGQYDEIMAQLGDDADEYTNYLNTLDIARNEAVANNQNPFPWFNLGSTLVKIAESTEDSQYYQQAALAFDNARNLGLPWRMTWYQFDIYEAYLAMERYDDVISLARNTLDTSSNYVEESYYYAGIAREMMGETQRAIDNYNAVLSFNPNFYPARERRDALLETSS